MSRGALALVVILAAALAARLIGLDSGLWFDEIWLLTDFGRLPLGEVLTTYKSDNNHPLFTVLSWSSLHVFGESAWSLRLPAVLFGMLGLFATWRLGRRIASEGEALAAVALLAFSYHHVWFSQNARGYTALMFFTVAATDYFLRALDDGRRRDAIGLGVCLALGTWTHLTAVFVAATLALVWLLQPLLRPAAPRDGRRAAALGLVLAPLLSLALHAPILGEMIGFLFPEEGPGKVPSEWTTPWWAIRATVESLGVGFVPGLLALAAAAALFLIGVASYVRQDRRLPILFLLPAVLGAGVMIGLGRNLWPRFFFFVGAFLVLIVVRSLKVLADRIAGQRPERAGAVFMSLVVLGVLGSSALLARNYELPKQDFEGARAWIEKHRNEDDVVITVGLATLPYERYHDAGYIAVESVEELERALAGGRRGLVLHTLPEFLSSRHPELAKRLENRGREAARFRGTVGGGDVVVIVLDP